MARNHRHSVAVAAVSALLVAACRGNTTPASAEPQLPPPTAPEIDAALNRAPEHLGGLHPITMSWNPDHRAEIKSAVAIAEGGLLKVIASASEDLSCDHPEQPQGKEWFLFAVDSGPTGDFYMARSTTMGVAFGITHDITSWRETYNANSHFEILPWTPDSESTELRVQWRRVLHNPDPPVITQVTTTGAMPLTLCKSARDLLAATQKLTPAEVSREPVHVRVGDTSFDPKRVFVFLFDDGKNGPIVSSIGFYDSDTANCDLTTRQLGDDGGGVSGLQLEVGQAGASPAGLNLGTLQPISVDVVDVNAGGGVFGEKSISGGRLFGTIDFTAGHFGPEYSGEIAGFIHVDGKMNTARPVDALISGSFHATVCRRQYW
jgi:hypothetical protein